MAIEIEGGHLCKITFSENGKSFTRRVNAMLVQRADGQVVRLIGAHLPDTVYLTTGGHTDGKGLLEVIERPAQSVASPAPQAEQLYMVATPKRPSSERDAFFFVLGMLATLVMCMLVFSAWVEVHDIRLRATSPARYRD